MVHIFTCLGIFLAVDVNSGAVHVIDRIAYDILSLLNGSLSEKCPKEVFEQLSNYKTEEISETWNELYKLQQEGMLFSDDSYIDPNFAYSLQKDAPIKAICLHVSHDCNLRCEYCFASTGDFGTGNRSIMDADTAKRAIDFVVERSGSRHNIEVDFFGGEPLMAMDTVKETINYARAIEKEKGKYFRFTITTNGVLLNDENIEYINQEMSNVVLSLDGRPEINDSMRKTISGGGSYNIVVPKFKKLVDSRGPKDYYLRGTFTKHNLDFVADVLHIVDLGFKNVSVEPVVGTENCEYAIKDEDINYIMEQYEVLAKELLYREDINFFHFNVDLSQGPCVIKRMRGCGAGCEYVAITPEGDIYPCHQFVGHTDYKLGNLYDKTFSMDISRKFSELNIDTKPECKSCWARFYCSGGCSASNFLVNGDVKIPNQNGCKMQKKRLECAIAIKAFRAGLV